MKLSSIQQVADLRDRLYADLTLRDAVMNPDAQINCNVTVLDPHPGSRMDILSADALLRDTLTKFYTERVAVTMMELNLLGVDVDVDTNPHVPEV